MVPRQSFPEFTEPYTAAFMLTTHAARCLRGMLKPEDFDRMLGMPTVDFMGEVCRWLNARVAKTGQLAEGLRRKTAQELLAIRQEIGITTGKDCPCTYMHGPLASAAVSGRVPPAHAPHGFTIKGHILSSACCAS